MSVPLNTRPERVPESELHLDERASEPMPQGEAIGRLGELDHEILAIILDISINIIHGCNPPLWDRPLRESAPRHVVSVRSDWPRPGGAGRARAIRRREFAGGALPLPKLIAVPSLERAQDF
jgi:hypothetical protein